MVVIELASDAPLARDLAAGGVFVPGCALRVADECELVVCGANRRISVPARVVYVDEGAGGAGLELIGFSTELRDQLAELEPIDRSARPADDDDLAVPVASLPGDDDRTTPVSTGVHAAPDDDLAVPITTADDDHLTIPVSTGVHLAAEARPAPPVPPAAEAEAEAALFDAAYAESAPAAGGADHGFFDIVDAARPPATDAAGPAASDAAADPADHEPSTPERGEPRAPRNVHERLRGLPLVAQLKLAASGELHERIVLERLYGKNVWETLLRNPRLTPPEVSRIARYGSLPRVLLEIILASNAWLAVPEVRRALLSNPRLPTDQIMKVLRLVPRHELRLATTQTAYPQAVRSAARMLLGGE